MSFVALFQTGDRVVQYSTVHDKPSLSCFPTNPVGNSRPRVSLSNDCLLECRRAGLHRQAGFAASCTHTQRKLLS